MKSRIVTVTLHSQSGAGYAYYIKTPLNSATCWRRGDRHSVHAYTRDLEHKLNARWNEGYRRITTLNPKVRKALQNSEKNEDL